MSYSFQVIADTADDARDEISKKFDEVVERYPVHERDRKAVLRTAGEFVDLIEVPEGKKLAISVSGSIGTADDKITHASVSINANTSYS